MKKLLVFLCAASMVMCVAANVQALSFSPSALDFGEVDIWTSSTIYVEATNDSTDAIKSLRVFGTGSAAFVFDRNNDWTVPWLPGVLRKLEVTFSPLGNDIGNKGDLLTFEGTYDNALNENFSSTMSLSGTGVISSLDEDGDGVPDVVDECLDSDLSDTVVIDGIDTGVPNSDFESGCTISDLIADWAEEALTHGDFVSAVADLTNSLKKMGVITGGQKGAIQSAAARADMP